MPYAGGLSECVQVWETIPLSDRMEGWVVAEELGLAEFLADLRSDLQQAVIDARMQAAAQMEAGWDWVLWFGLEEVTVTLEVAHERTHSGEASGKVGGKFWVFASAEASAKVGTESKRSGTQTLSLTLKPRLKTKAVDEHGQTVINTTGVDVEGDVTEGEQLPPPPVPKR